MLLITCKKESYVLGTIVFVIIRLKLRTLLFVRNLKEETGNFRKKDFFGNRARKFKFFKKSIKILNFTSNTSNKILYSGACILNPY